MSWVNRVLGDEVDVAYKQAVKAGFPEGTAQKIATGELPMDIESRMQRAKEQGFVTKGLHGTNADFMEFDKSKIGATDTGTVGEGFYFAERPSMANRYAKGEGGNVIPVLLKTDNPSYITNPSKDIPVELKAKAGSPAQIRENLAQYSKDQSNWLKSQGNDSVIWDKGNGFNEKMVLEPNQIRSINAAFDPDNKNSGNLLGFNGKNKLSTNPLDYINPQAVLQPEMRANDFADQSWSERVNNAVFDLSTELGASPQYAQKMAGVGSGAVEFTPVQSAMDVADYASGKGDAVSAGFGLLDLIPGVGKGASIAAKGIVDNSGKIDPRYAFGKRKADIKDLESVTRQVEKTGVTSEDAPRVSIFDYEGRPFVTTMSDRTDSGRRLTKINNQELSYPVDLIGGQGYMLNNDGKVWASAKGAVSNILNEAGRAEQSGFGNALLVPWRMSPSGKDFAHMTGETMIAAASAGLGKRDKNKADKLIKNIIPGWKGVDNPMAADQYADSTGDQRKKIMQILDRDFRSDGGISISEARYGVSDPKQLGGKDAMLQNIGVINTSKGMGFDSKHPSYPYAVSGEGIGELKEDLPVHLLLPDVVKERGIVDPANPGQTDIRSLQFGAKGGVITNDILKAIEDYLKESK